MTLPSRRSAEVEHAAAGAVVEALDATAVAECMSVAEKLDIVVVAVDIVSEVQEKSAAGWQWVRLNCRTLNGQALSWIV